jgi:GTP diphosphokinase / guanosine-3',5'-bis(diphosphate) 3'-diphosphatase
VFHYNDLREELAQYLDHESVEKITEAYALAASAHETQWRQTGDPYIIHPIAVARILASMRMDPETIMAALMHDVLEDTNITKEALIKQFGQVVADLVDGVSKLTQIHFESREEAQAENFRKMLLAMTKDIRVILIKLADRLHNMRTLEALSPEKRRRIARETLEIYAPIAKRLGMHNFCVEFEDLGFSALYPGRYRVLKTHVRKARGNRKQIFKTIETDIKKCFKKANIPETAIHGREKHLYSIYRKMLKKHISFNEVMDVYAFRLVVPSVDECYRVLGLVHNLYKPVSGRFKDYIAIPKTNGYQSLHTLLVGPYGVPIEIQIRTEEMERLAENGIAAHWLYKTNASTVDKAQAWLSNLLSLGQSTGTPLEFIENVKIDLFPDEVYVFTPKGEIMELPGNATAVDFAYAVHTDVGNSCVAAKINRRLVPLSTRIANGQTVEIISAPGARPNPAWLNFVATGKARSGIRHFLKSQHRFELILLGQRLLNVALRAISHTLEKIPEETMTRYLAESELKTLDALYEAIGKGERSASLVARQLATGSIDEAHLEDSAKPQGPLQIKGTEGLVVKFGKCCWPLPHDPILGVMSSGQGLTIHHDSCRQVKKYASQPDKAIAVQWSDEIEGDFQVELQVEVHNKRGILASLANAIALTEANIDMISSQDKDGRYSLITMIISVRDRIHLAAVMRQIRANKAVNKIIRSRA